MGASSSFRISEAARRYASALFDLARDGQTLSEAETALKAVGQILSENDDLQAMVRGPMYAPEDKAAALLQITDKMGTPDLVRNFIGVVAQNGRAHDLPGIVTAFSELCAKARGTKAAIVRSAHPLTEAQLGQLRDLVSASVGADADLTVEVDEDLVGGLQLQIGSRLIDASLRTKLDGLNAAMKGA